MRHAILLGLALALAGCKKEEPAKQQPRTALFDATPSRAAATLALVAIDRALTQQVNASAIVLIRRDDSVAVTQTPSDAMYAEPGVPLAGLEAHARELAQLGGLADELDRLPPPLEPDELDAGEGKMGHKDTEPMYGNQARQAGVLTDPCFLAMSAQAGAETVPAPAGLRGVAVDRLVCQGHAALILADEGAPASRLIAVMSQLRASQLGVTADGGAHARTLGVAFTYFTGNRPGSDAQEVGVTLRPDAGVDASGLPPAAAVRLRIDGEVTAGALIHALAALLGAHAETIAIGEPSMYVMESGGGVDAAP